MKLILEIFLKQVLTPFSESGNMNYSSAKYWLSQLKHILDAIILLLFICEFMHMLNFQYVKTTRKQNLGQILRSSAIGWNLNLKRFKIITKQLHAVRYNRVINIYFKDETTLLNFYVLQSWLTNLKFKCYYFTLLYIDFISIYFQIYSIIFIELLVNLFSLLVVNLVEQNF